MKKQQDQRDVLRRIRFYERRYSSRLYDGISGKQYQIKKGVIPVMISAPHSVNHFRDGQIKVADVYTGGLAAYLHETTGCHVITSVSQTNHDPNHDSLETCEYKKALVQYVKRNGIRVLIDLHGASSQQNFAVCLGTVDEQNSSLNGYSFVLDFIQKSFDSFYQNLSSDVKEVHHNTIFKASNRSTVTNTVSRNTDAACIQVELHRSFRDPSAYLYETAMCLSDVIKTLAHVDWNADKIEVYTVNQSTTQKPQDKIEISQGALEQSVFEEFDSLFLASAYASSGMVRLHASCLPDASDNCVYLTNRLIVSLFEREWLEEEEESSRLLGKPILLYGYEKKMLKIGMPKADRIDQVSLSSALYEKVKQEKKYDFLVYHRYSDSRMFLSLEGANYDDKGRITEEKVMIPRYFKTLLGYELPMNKIRYEEYLLLIKRLKTDEEIHGELLDLLEKCYQKMPGENYVELVSGLDEEVKAKLSEYQKKEPFYCVELLKVPKQKEAAGIKAALQRKISAAQNKMLNLMVGSSVHMLRVVWTNETDDRNQVVRITRNMMVLLGVEQNDKVELRFGKKMIVLRVLEGDFDSDCLIGVPAPARKTLGMNSINDVVSVQREMRHIFKRHSVQQALALLGTLLSIVSVLESLQGKMTDVQLFVAFVVILVISVPLMLYWILSEERVKVK